MNQLRVVRGCIFLLTAVAILSGVVFAGPAANPVPLVNTPLVPSAAVPGGPGFTLTVNGTGFVSGSVVNWNGSPRTTTFLSQSQLTAAILASDIAAPTTASVTVTSPAPGGGESSVAYFSVTVPKTRVPFSTSGYPLNGQGGAIIVGDFNGDGKPDLAILSSLGLSCAVLLGNGDGTFQNPKRIALPKAAEGLTTADFNADGKLDLAMTEINSKGQIEVLLGNGDGTFQAPQTFSTGQGQGSGIVAADLNRDGKLDLIVANQNEGTISVLLGNGDGTFQTGMTTSAGIDPIFVAVGDFNNDGILDLAVTTNPGATVSILLGNGDGSFAAGVPLALSDPALYIAAGDFNGDGILDLAVVVTNYRADSGSIEVLLGNGDGTFRDGDTYASGLPYFEMTTLDVNGDGKLDLISASCCIDGAGGIATLLGNGDGTFQPASYYPFTAGSTVFATADLNGDGSMDIIVPSPLADGVLSIMLQTPATLAPGALSFAATVIGSSSSPQTTTLTNVGAGSLAITGVSIGGADAGDFSQTNNCPSSLAQGASCAINVTFSPTAVGTRTAVIKVGDSGAPKLPDVALKGTGKAAAMSPR